MRCKLLLCRPTFYDSNVRLPSAYTRTFITHKSKHQALYSNSKYYGITWQTHNKQKYYTLKQTTTNKYTALISTKKYYISDTNENNFKMIIKQQLSVAIAKSYAMLHRVVCQTLTDYSEELTASIVWVQHPRRHSYSPPQEAQSYVHT
jgi:uncharacterized membrane protein